MNNICYNNVEAGRIIGIVMQICKVFITTSVDGQESKLQRMGKIQIEEERVLLHYLEEGAQVALTVGTGHALIERQGDYGLRIPLRQGENSVGRLGVGGSEGELPVETECIRCERNAESVEIYLQYCLAFGEEKQKMRLHIHAKTKGGRG